jgi:sporulation protein YlmC with PRC-barrel domain
MKIKKITEVLGVKVFTDGGDYFGEIEEANLYENKVDGWRIRVDQSLTSLFGGARGVIIPHKFVKAMSDICIINQAAMPAQQESDLTDEMADIDLI